MLVSCANMSTVNPPEPLLPDEHDAPPVPKETPNENNLKPRKSITDEVEINRVALIRERLRRPRKH